MPALAIRRGRVAKHEAFDALGVRVAEFLTEGFKAPIDGESGNVNVRREHATD